MNRTQEKILQREEAVRTAAEEVRALGSSPAFEQLLEVFDRNKERILTREELAVVNAKMGKPRTTARKAGSQLFKDVRTVNFHTTNATKRLAKAGFGKGFAYALLHRYQEAMLIQKHVLRGLSSTRQRIYEAYFLHGRPGRDCVSLLPIGNSKRTVDYHLKEIRSALENKLSAKKRLTEAERLYLEARKEASESRKK